LVSTRRIVVIPNANALGYYRKEHLEGSVDPAEDFPYNIGQSHGSCMRTIAARTLNEIFQTHMFQVALSFKEGDDKIEYSWGSQQYLSPDYVTYSQFASSISNVVGGENFYPYAASNTRSLNPKMAFQDWAYAASWERLRTTTCTPESYSGYATAKTRYSVGTNRALSFTVSSSSASLSTGRRLDSVSNVFHAKDDSEGLEISRNMRLLLVSTDLVQPYVSIFGINNIAISDDVVPSSKEPGNLCDTSRIVAVPGALSTVIVEWTVGGGLDIAQTDLWVAKVNDLPDTSVCSMNLADGFEAVKEAFTKINPLPRAGSGFFSLTGPDPSPQESVSKPFSILAGHGSVSSAKSNAMGGISNTQTIDSEGNGSASISVNLLGPVFRAEIDLSNYEQGDQLILVASAIVDQDWSNVPNAYYQPLVNPQSHIANMRTNPAHEFEISEKKLKGRLDWFSIPVTVVVDSIDIHAGGVELYMRLDEKNGYEKPKGRPLSRFGNNIKKSSFLTIGIWLVIAAVGIILIAVFVFVVILCRKARRPGRRQRTMTFSDGVFKGNSFTDQQPHQQHHQTSRNREGFFVTSHEQKKIFDIQENRYKDNDHDDYETQDEGDAGDPAIEYDTNEQTMHGHALANVYLNNDPNEQMMHGDGIVDVDLNNDPNEHIKYENALVDVDLNNDTDNDNLESEVIGFESKTALSSSMPSICLDGVV
jgi:hypothetical protein